MASFDKISANIRIVNDDRRSVCSINNVNPTVSAQTAAAFVDALKTIYNNGECSARLNITQIINTGQ